MTLDYKNWRRDPLVLSLRKELSDKGVGDRVVIAVSGGVDSTGLLLAAIALQNENINNFRIHVVHVDHGLRSESILEAKHVENLASLLNVPFELCRLKLRPGTSSAEARRVREESLYKAAIHAKSKEDWTGHHAGDQAETVILSLARGTWRPGHGSIHQKRTLRDDILIRRPLLHAVRTDFIRICKSANVLWIEDPTNARLDKPRGKIRHQVLPALESIYPGSTVRIANSAYLELPEGKCPEMPLEGWDRADLSSCSIQKISTILRNHVKQQYASLSSRIRRTQFLEAARLIKDLNSEKRVINWPQGLELHIAANYVLILKH